ncbi:hypothetical protein IHE45_06G033800 [Dioscorea alata]|uniref:Uncharacterized protein n=1 Tax=Dioscorea alata TaxID=55571 RepID=A0ACB7VWB3_DIOAL|nr:hypothetical protein IHE45_06G033800 [Dioscorea alata]
MATTLVNARCYLAPVVETVSKLKKHMHKQHWDILRWTPFGHFMDITPVLQERGVLDAVLQVYDEKKQAFQIGQSLLPFRAEDVALILGLRCDGDIVSFKHEKDASEFENK